MKVEIGRRFGAERAETPPGLGIAPGASGRPSARTAGQAAEQCAGQDAGAGPAPFWAGRRFARHRDFYAEVYPHALVTERAIGRIGATLMSTDQGAGDWSDAASPDLVIAVQSGRPVGTSMDLGAGRFRAVMRSGQFGIVPPDSATRIIKDGPHRMRILGVPYPKLLSFAGPDAGLPADGDFGPLHSRLVTDAEIAGIVERLGGLDQDGGGSLLADGLILQLSARLVQLRGAPAPLVRGGLAPWQVRKVTDFLMGSLGSDVPLADLARLVGLSPHHFCRAFKQSTGLPPHRWRQARRMERAAELLIQTQRPIAEIAAEVGYEDPSQLGTVFRRAYGLSPSQYRRARQT